MKIGHVAEIKTVIESFLQSDAIVLQRKAHVANLRIAEEHRRISFWVLAQDLIANTLDFFELANSHLLKIDEILRNRALEAGGKGEREWKQSHGVLAGP